MNKKTIEDFTEENDLAYIAMDNGHLIWLREGCDVRFGNNSVILVDKNGQVIEMFKDHISYIVNLQNILKK